MYRHYAYSLRTKKKKKKKKRTMQSETEIFGIERFIHILFQRADSRTTKFPLIYLYDIDIERVSALNDFWVAKGG